MSSPSPKTLDPQSAAAHLPRLRRFARSLCGSSQLAEDLTQETYVRVLARPRRVHEDSEFPYLARAGTLGQGGGRARPQVQRAHDRDEKRSSQ